MEDQKEEACEKEGELLREMLAHWDGEKNLIALLLSTQDLLGYLPEDGIVEIAGYLNISEATVYGVATFYNQFRFTPPGKNHIEVCMGTACHVKRGEIVMESWERTTGIKEGEVSEDREFSLERVNCVGCCVLAPVTVINKEVHGQMDPTKVDGFLLRHRLKQEAEARKKETPVSNGELDGDAGDDGSGG